MDIILLVIVRLDINLIFNVAWKYDIKTIKSELLIIGNNPNGISHLISLSGENTLNKFNSIISVYKLTVDSKVKNKAVRNNEDCSSSVRFSEQSFSVEELKPMPAIIENIDR